MRTYLIPKNKTSSFWSNTLSLLFYIRRILLYNNPIFFTMEHDKIWIFSIINSYTIICIFWPFFHKFMWSGNNYESPIFTFIIQKIKLTLHFNKPIPIIPCPIKLINEIILIFPPISTIHFFCFILLIYFIIRKRRKISPWVHIYVNIS